MKLSACLSKDIITLDERRLLALPGNAEETIRFCVDHFFFVANEAIAEHGYFAVALSGGSTPKAIFTALSLPENLIRTDWSKFLVFWSDERSVPPSHSESNYHMAMASGWDKLPVSEKNIFRMQAEADIEVHALDYEKLIESKIPQKHFDLVMLGMGEDGHTASLFPHTKGLHDVNHLVVANYIPQKDTWRMSLTFKSINEATNTIVYVLGSGKETMLHNILKGPYQPELYPAQRLGTPNHKALWVADDKASILMRKP